MFLIALEEPYRTLLVSLVGVLVLWLTICVLRRRALRSAPRDPQREFTAQQRREAANHAGGRCEMELLPFVRCRARGSHADHWWPWSAGGASSPDNLVWACAPHNLAKSAHLPGRWATSRLAARRRRYWPAQPAPRPGQRYADLFSTRL